MSIPLTLVAHLLTALPGPINLPMAMLALRKLYRPRCRQL